MAVMYLPSLFCATLRCTLSQNCNPQWHVFLRSTPGNLVGPQTLFTAVITWKIRSVKEQVLLRLLRIVTLLKSTSQAELQYIAVI